MTAAQRYSIILFKSVSDALKAEQILKMEGISHKLVPVPKQISSDCGICLRCDTDIYGRVDRALQGKVDVIEVRSL